ncbi:MAG: WD40/YVTN/BNR-like repeat-containing protein [Candidatus Kryptoniota bacterium]
MDSGYSYASGVSGVCLSTDEGATWSGISNGLPGNQVFSIAVEDTTLFAATFSNGVFRSTDNGKSWMQASTGIVSSEVFSIAGSGSVVCAEMDYNSVFSSTDYGTTWTADTSLHVPGVYSVAVIGNKIYAMTESGIFVSSDNGGTWNTLNGGVMDTSDPSMLIQSGPNLIAACRAYKTVFISSDNGITWKYMSGLPPFASLATSGSNVLAGTVSGIFLSTDNGETWAVVNDLLDDINAIASAGSEIFAGRYLWPYSLLSPPNPPGGVFRSTDGGLSWSPYSNGNPNDPQVYAIAVHGQDVYAGSEPGLYVSTINGNNWANVGQNLPEWTVLSLFVNDSSVFVGEERGGIWRAPLSEVTAIKQPIKSVLPKSFLLEQNYPIHLIRQL